jgi:hypothetical protein
VDGDGSFAARCFSRVHVAHRVKCARDLDTEVAQDWRARLFWVVIRGAF